MMYQCRKCKRAPCGLAWENQNEPYMNCTHFVAPPPSNADRIRAMSDEELAELIGDNIDCCICRDKFQMSAVKPCKMDCYTEWLNWLKQEHTIE